MMETEKGALVCGRLRTKSDMMTKRRDLIASKDSLCVRENALLVENMNLKVYIKALKRNVMFMAYE